MNYDKKTMTKEYATQISKWDYPDEYKEYNLPSYEEMEKLGYGITKEENYNNYICYLDKEEILAYVNFKQKDDVVYLGIGIKPDMCGKGLGKFFMEESINEIKTRFPGKKLMVEVRSWNKRSIKLCLNGGFKIIETVIKKDRNQIDSEFIIMELNV